MSVPLPAIGSTEPWAGGRASTRAVCVLAPNASVITLDGTNTWLLHEPFGARRLAGALAVAAGVIALKG